MRVRVTTTPASLVDMRQALLWMERTLLFAAFVCLGWLAGVWTRAAVDERQAKHQIESIVSTDRAAGGSTAAVIATALDKLPRAGLIGVLDVDRIGLSVAVREGDDETTLRTAAGHLADTPLPWDEGNSALAGHRDTFFRPLRNLRVGDTIRLATPHGTFSYRVSRLMIVKPSEVWVLNASKGVNLTLITCYPFTYIGSAPNRFVVQAERIAASGDQ